jgi:predicted dehydrogenase
VIRVGVIGLGKMGKLHLMNALRIDGVNVVAGADRNEGNRLFAQNHRVKTYGDYASLLDKEKIDAAIISLPTHLKKEAVVLASESGLDVFLDKPLAGNATDAEEIVQKIRKEKTRLTVGVNYRFFDSVQKIRNSMESGKLGDVVLATSELIMNGPFSHPLVPTPVADWWLSKEMAGGGALLDLGYHVVDLFNWMFGDLQVAYSNLGWRFNLPVEDSAIIVLESKKTSVKCVASVGWFMKMIFPAFNFRINLNGTAGSESTDRYAPSDLRVHAAKEAVSNLLRRIAMRKVHYLSYTYYYASFHSILESFFDMIKKDVDNPISIEQQLQVMRIIDECYKQGGG